ncbi:LON peptidase substrate-binding domain-containing protein [Shewanella gaetbuli]|uniref:ATP-dependent protease n=1 Tax=Shewanella gaetbuli TaxID=220752 RepID=A0A9X2CL36_9GAMM|nr:LON peptidase substrate-binding domain-containing protein [Shewanella gaetbuli]MCL1142279.1 ATP-dependent protease [Shewanella gaetbuli]
MQSREMALFIQDGVLLPNGRLEFKVVLPDQLALVASVFKGEYGIAFAAQKNSGNLPCYRTITECRIIDFNQLEDDSLSIVLEGVQRLKVLSAAKLRNQMWIARTLVCPNWRHEPIAGEFEIISAALEQFYEVNPDLYELYSQVYLQDASWVSQRWLEVLPMYNCDKLRLVEQPNCHKTMDFVLQLLKSHVGL